MTLEQCELCHLERKAEQKVVMENEHCAYSQLVKPEIIGSGIIVPKRHRKTVFDLTAEEWQATYDLLHKVKQYTDDKYKPDGYNIGWNCGEVGGQHIFHAHLHVIPRFSDEPMAGKGIRYLFKSSHNKRPREK